MSEKILVENLRRDARLRAETDRILSPLWILLPLTAVIILIALLIVGITTFALFRQEQPWQWFPGQEQPWQQFPLGITPILGGIIGLGIVGIVTAILYVYLVYSLIKRRNRHFQREWTFIEDLISTVRSIASKKKKDVGVSLSSVEHTLRDMKMNESEKNPILWVILLLISPISIIASLYILYFLTVDFYRHERREDNLLEDISKAMEIIESPISTRRTKSVPERSYILYLVLTIVTLGIFGIYWFYTLIIDPNNHFQEHINLEDTIMYQLTTAI